jgi:hypothetical protein
MPLSSYQARSRGMLLNIPPCLCTNFKIFSKMSLLHQEACHIRDFPPEVLCRIFEQYDDNGISLPTGFTIKDGPRCLGQVCGTWRGIVWSFPSLWSNITIEPNSQTHPRQSEISSRLVECLEQSLKYSGNSALCFAFHLYTDDADRDRFSAPVNSRAIFAVTAPHLPRIHHFTLTFSRETIDSLASLPRTGFPALRTLRLKYVYGTPGPRQQAHWDIRCFHQSLLLRELHISGNMNWNFDFRHIKLSRFVATDVDYEPSLTELGTCYNVEHVKHLDISGFKGTSRYAPTKLYELFFHEQSKILHSLQVFRLLCTHLPIFRRLTLPALNELYVVKGMGDDSPPGMDTRALLLEFFERSPCPLRRLVLYQDHMHESTLELVSSSLSPLQGLEELVLVQDTFKVFPRGHDCNDPMVYSCLMKNLTIIGEKGMAQNPILPRLISLTIKNRGYSGFVCKAQHDAISLADHFCVNIPVSDIFTMIESRLVQRDGVAKLQSLILEIGYPVHYLNVPADLEERIRQWKEDGFEFATTIKAM